MLVPRGGPGRPADFATRASLVASQRYAGRRTRRARRALRLVGRVLGGVLAAAATLVVLVVTAHWLRTTPLLAVTRVAIQGTRRLTEDAVRSTAGVEPGTNILTLDVHRVRARAEALPGVRSARVVRELPGRVTVMVDEREPYALVNLSDVGDPTRAARLVWVDAAGYLVGPEPHPGTPPLPILSGAGREVAAGDAAPSDGLRAGLALLRIVQRTGGWVAGRISEIDVGGADGPVLYLVDGAEVRVGTEAWEERLARLDGVLGQLDARGERVLSVDLRFRDLVVLKPRLGAPTGAGTRGGRSAVSRRTTPSNGGH